MHHTFPRLARCAVRFCGTVPAALLLCATLLCGVSGAEDYLVPFDYDDIQGAIDAAESGDTILVDPGLYVENIDFLGKAIVLRSVDGPESTTINGTDLTRGEDDGCVVLFASGEGSDSILDGFTIRGGVGVTSESTSGNEVLYGGGIYIDDASPTIRSCVVFDNSATQGGGMWIRDSEVEIINCVIRENQAGYGAGLRILGDGSAVLIRDSAFEENSGDWGAAIHAGLILSGTDLTDATVTVENCEFRNNSAEFSGGAINILGHGSISDTLFVGNTSELTGGVTWIHGVAEFQRCAFENNESEIGGVVHNSAVDRELTFERCFFGGNTAVKGGVYAGDTGTTNAELLNCTLVANAAEDGGAVFLESDIQESEHSVTIQNSIVWDCDLDPIVEGLGTLSVTYSCIEGGFAGAGNIEDDPKFVDADAADYHLRADSPCVDAGNPTIIDDDGSTVDLGAFAFLHSPFLRGDTDSNGDVNALVDVIFFLEWGFSNGDAPPCLDGCDVDDNGNVHPLVDTIYLLDWQFTGGDEPPSPGPYDCGSDMTVDEVDCVESSACD